MNGADISEARAKAACEELSQAGRSRLTRALVFAVLGAVAFVIGIVAAFDRAGDWSNFLSMAGVLAMIYAGLQSLMASATGVWCVVSHRRMPLWWPVSLVTTIGAVIGGIRALQL